VKNKKVNLRSGKRQQKTGERPWLGRYLLSQ
jgi:hypothetical protein